MNYEIEKLGENDSRIRFKVKIPEDVMEREKRAVYFLNRPFYSEPGLERIPYQDFEEVTFSPDQLEKTVFCTFEDDINDQIMKKFDLDESSIITPYFVGLEKENGDYAVFEYLKLPELNYENVFDYVKDLEFNKDETPDFNLEADRNLQALREQNVRLVPAEKIENLQNTINVTYRRINDEGEEEIETSNKKMYEILPEIETEIESFLGSVPGDVIEFNDSFAEILESNFGPGKYDLLINQVYAPEYPELDDDFAAEVSEFDTLDELKKSLFEQSETLFFSTIASDMIQKAFFDFIHNQMQLLPMPFALYVGQPSDFYNNLLAISQTLDSFYLTDIEADEIIRMCDDINEYYFDEFLNNLLDSELGEFAPTDEEVKARMEPLIEKTRTVSNAIEEDYLDNYLSVYKNRGALMRYLNQKSEANGNNE